MFSPIGLNKKENLARQLVLYCIYAICVLYSIIARSRRHLILTSRRKQYYHYLYCCCCCAQTAPVYLSDSKVEQISINSLKDLLLLKLLSCCSFFFSHSILFFQIKKTQCKHLNNNTKIKFFILDIFS